MSQMIVRVQRVTKISEHGNADLLEVAHIGAWETCVKKNIFAMGELVVFIPPDAILPKALHEYLGITQYCGGMPKLSEEYEQGKMRVRATRLRGVRSFGTLMTLGDVELYLRWECGQTGYSAYNLKEGDDVAELLGITKYEPPEKVSGGDIAAGNALFHKYTSIERYQNFPLMFEFHEPVVITEKIHGTNCRVGMVIVDNELEWMAGSHKTRRKQYGAPSGDGKVRQSLYWSPMTENMQEMIRQLQIANHAVSVVVFCEIYGPGIQDMHYGGKKEFRVYDISVNGIYLNWNKVTNYCDMFDIPVVPVLYLGPFSPDVLMEHTDGPTVVCEEVVTKFKGREGCVVKPFLERQTSLGRRVILKSVSADYLGRKGATDNA